MYRFARVRTAELPRDLSEVSARFSVQGLLPAPYFDRVGTGCVCSVLKIRRASIGYRVAEPHLGRVCIGCGYPGSEHPGSTRKTGILRHIFII